MRFMTKKNMKVIIEQNAKAEGVSVKEYRQELKDAIQFAKSDPEESGLYYELFGDSTPSPEEFLQKMTLTAIRRTK